MSGRKDSRRPKAKGGAKSLAQASGRCQSCSWLSLRPHYYDMSHSHSSLYLLGGNSPFPFGNSPFPNRPSPLAPRPSGVLDFAEKGRKTATRPRGSSCPGGTRGEVRGANSICGIHCGTCSWMSPAIFSRTRSLFWSGKQGAGGVAWPCQCCNVFFRPDPSDCRPGASGQLPHRQGEFACLDEAGQERAGELT